MPKGMEKLTHLRTVKEFTVGLFRKKEFTVGYMETCCSLQGLEKLNGLQGYLRITGLEDMTDANDAREARLWAKTGMHYLSLCGKACLPWGSYHNLKILICGMDEMNNVGEEFLGIERQDLGLGQTSSSSSSSSITNDNIAFPNLKTEVFQHEKLRRVGIWEPIHKPGRTSLFLHDNYTRS
ncbi:hypothetical protein DITRI_Ditri15bG0078200 [Diplodiscus trichospermus]